MPESTSSASLRRISSCVITTSGLVFPTAAAASGPVPVSPTTSIPLEERMAARPSRNMVWSSARCTRTASVMSVSLPPQTRSRAGGSARRSPKDSWWPTVNHARAGSATPGRALGRSGGRVAVRPVGPVERRQDLLGAQVRHRLGAPARADLRGEPHWPPLPSSAPRPPPRKRRSPSPPAAPDRRRRGAGGRAPPRPGGPRKGPGASPRRGGDSRGGRRREPRRTGAALWIRGPAGRGIPGSFRAGRASGPLRRERAWRHYGRKRGHGCWAAQALASDLPSTLRAKFGNAYLLGRWVNKGLLVCLLNRATTSWRVPVMRRPLFGDALDERSVSWAILPGTAGSM